MPLSSPTKKNRRKRKQHPAVKRKPVPVRTPAPKKSRVKRKRGEPKLPVTPEEFRSDEKRLRKESCALCPDYKRLSRKDLRHRNFPLFVLEKNQKLLKKMQAIFPNYETNKRGVPVVLCQSHFMNVKLYVDKPTEKVRFTPEFIASQNEKFKKAPAYREASQVTPLSKEHSASLNMPKYPLKNILKIFQTFLR